MTTKFKAKSTQKKCVEKHVGICEMCAHILWKYLHTSLNCPGRGDNSTQHFCATFLRIFYKIYLKLICLLVEWNAKKRKTAHLFLAIFARAWKSGANIMKQFVSALLKNQVSQIRGLSFWLSTLSTYLWILRTTRGDNFQHIFVHFLHTILVEIGSREFYNSHDFDVEKNVNLLSKNMCFLPKSHEKTTRT